MKSCPVCGNALAGEIRCGVCGAPIPGAGRKRSGAKGSGSRPSPRPAARPAARPAPRPATVPVTASTPRASSSPMPRPTTPPGPAPSAGAPATSGATSRSSYGRRFQALWWQGWRGHVRQVPRRSEEPEPFNLWKIGAIVVGFLVLAPILIPIWLVLFAIKLGILITVGMVSPRLGGLLGGRKRSPSILDELLFYRMTEVLFRSQPRPVYHYLLDCDGDILEARQAGEFLAGAIHTGHDITLVGTRFGGILRIRYGRNHTTGGVLLPRPNRWFLAFLVLSGILAFELGLVLSMSLAAGL
jgi:hypothetical protein